MIVSAHKRTKTETLYRKYGVGAVIADITSDSTDSLVQLSPFYPHGDIPIPFSGEYTAMSVEGIWQGLKVFEKTGIDPQMFRNRIMKNLKRSTLHYGKVIGHQKGVNNQELLSYLEARLQIYIPSYQWVLENKVQEIIERLRQATKNKTIILLDYNTNGDIHNLTQPLSHAALVKAYVEGAYPFSQTNEKQADIPIQPTLWD